MKVRTIILDIDETLLHRSDDENALHSLDIWNQNPSVRSRTFIIRWPDGGKCWMIKRPYLDEFIIQCFQKFDQVIVWSAGGKNYVESVVKHIFSGHPSPHYVFWNQHCANYELDYSRLHKPILHLKNYNVDVDLESTVIVDDRARNFADNIKNGALIAQYQPYPSVISLINDNDMALLELIGWMNSDDFKQGLFTFHQWMSVEANH